METILTFFTRKFFSGSIFEDIIESHAQNMLCFTLLPEFIYYSVYILLGKSFEDLALLTGHNRLVTQHSEVRSRVRQANLIQYVPGKSLGYLTLKV